MRILKFITVCQMDSRIGDIFEPTRLKMTMVTYRTYWMTLKSYSSTKNVFVKRLYEIESYETGHIWHTLSSNLTHIGGLQDTYSVRLAFVLAILLELTDVTIPGSCISLILLALILAYLVLGSVNPYIWMICWNIQERWWDEIRTLVCSIQIHSHTI